MLSGALVHTGLDIGCNKDLSDLMLSFKHSRPPRSKVFPELDLSLVLWTLSEPPLNQCSMTLQGFNAICNLEDGVLGSFGRWSQKG